MTERSLLGRYLWRHGYNTSFYQVASQLAGPVLKSTVASTIINRNDTTYPSTADYFNIKTTCERYFPFLCICSLRHGLPAPLCTSHTDR